MDISADFNSRKDINKEIWTYQLSSERILSKILARKMDISTDFKSRIGKCGHIN
jgi:hypothetical protein